MVRVPAPMASESKRAIVQGTGQLEKADTFTPTPPLSPVTCVAARGDMVVAGHRDGTLRFATLSTSGKLQATWAKKVLTGPVSGVLFVDQTTVSAAAGSVIAVCSVDGRILTVAATTQFVDIHSLACSGHHLFAGLQDGDITVLDTTVSKSTLRHVNILPARHSSDVYCLAADAEFLVSGGGDNNVCVSLVKEALNSMKPVTSHQLLRLSGHANSVRCVAISGTGGGRHGVVVSGSDDRTIRVWDIHGGELLRVMKSSWRVHSLVVHDDFIVVATRGTRRLGPREDAVLTMWV